MRRTKSTPADSKAATRVQILKSAAAAFRKLGYHGATVEQIAAALHMKKGNLYYYFRNKEDILFACHQYSLDRLHELLEQTEQSGLAPEAKLRLLIVSFVHTILDELHGTALFLDLEALSPAHLKTVIVRRDRFDRGIRSVLEEGMAGGAFRAKRSEAARLRDSWRGELDSALVRPARRRKLAGDRRPLRGLPDRRVAAIVITPR